MPLDFPNSPNTNDVYSAAGKTWQWNGTSWVLLSLSINTSINTVDTETDGAVTIMDIGA